MTATSPATNAIPPIAAAAAGPAPRDGADIPVQPSDLLVEFIVGVLAPLFMAGCSGDLSFARLAAIETINAYHARSQAELVMITQIIGYGLAAMDNLRLSMDPGISLPMKLRLRGGASALNRAAQQNIRALEKARRDTSLTAAPDPAKQAVRADYPDTGTEADEPTQADVEATLAQARAMVKEAYARLQAAPSAEAAAGIPPAGAVDGQNDLARTGAAYTIPAEVNGQHAAVPPTSRKADLLRATAMSSLPNDLPLAAREALRRPGAPRKLG